MGYKLSPKNIQIMSIACYTKLKYAHPNLFKLNKDRAYHDNCY
jgi:hypothetical protein